MKRAALHPALTLILLGLLSGCTNPGQSTHTPPVVTPVNAVTGVAITSSAAELRSGAPVTLTAAVTGTGSFSRDVDWTVVQGGGTLSPARGVTTEYTAPTVLVDTDVILQATSVTTPAQSTRMTLRVRAAPGFTLGVKGSVALAAGGTAQVPVAVTRSGGHTANVTVSTGPLTGVSAALVPSAGGYTLTLGGAARTDGVTEVTLTASDGQQEVRQVLRVLHVPAAARTLSGQRTVWTPEQYDGNDLTVVLPDLQPDERVALIPFNPDPAVKEVTFDLIGQGGLAAQSLAAPSLGAGALAQQAVPTPDLHAGAQRILQAEAERALARAGASGLGSQSVPEPRRVLRSVNWATGQMEDVPATLRAVTPDLLIYVDDRVADGAVDVKRLEAEFAAVAPTTRARWGADTDLDGNGRILLLVTPLVQGGNGGLFWYDGLGVAAEQIVLGVGLYGQGMLAHEFKHVISIGRRGGDDAWLEEGLAVVASDLVGAPSHWHTDALLSDPAAHPTFHRGGTGPYVIGSYGPYYLLSRFVGERGGGDAAGVWAKFLSRTRKDLPSVPNAEWIAGASLPEVYADWVTTLMFDHTGLIAGFDYQGINLRDAAQGFRPLRYHFIGNDARRVVMANQNFFVTRGGAGGDSVIRVAGVSGRPHLVAVRFRGDLPYLPPGSVTGTLVSPDGSSLDGTQVCVATHANNVYSCVARQWQVLRTSAAQQAFEFQDVPTGTYRLAAWRDNNGNGQHDAGDWWGNLTADFRVEAERATTLAPLTLGVRK